MKLQLGRTDGFNTFTGYGEGYVNVNGVRHERNVTVLPGQVIPGWTDSAFETLTAADFERLAKLKPEILLLGTGKSSRFPPPALMRSLIEAQIGLEVMGTAAACRTYNILMAEGRNPVAALIVE